MDDLTAHIQRLERCVDDNLLHDSSYEDHWWRVLDFLELAGNAGMVAIPREIPWNNDDLENETEVKGDVGEIPGDKEE